MRTQSRLAPRVGRQAPYVLPRYGVLRYVDASTGRSRTTLPIADEGLTVGLITSIATIPEVTALAFAAFYILILAGTAPLVRVSRVARAVTPHGARYGELDGLRGVLAYGVVLHHSLIAYTYFTTGAWDWTRNPVLNQLGQTTVALFFMITGFLFTVRCTSATVDWRRLYISRFARLTPLYLVVVAAVFVEIMALTGFRLQVPPVELAMQAVRWLAFDLFGRPNINGFTGTWTLIAGVNWTLAFEWKFYVFGLPLVYLASRVVSGRGMLIGALVIWGACVAGLAIHPGQVQSLTYIYFLAFAHFVAGIFVALAWKDEALRKAMSTRWFRGLACLGVLAIGCAVDSRAALPYVGATCVFAAVLGGASLFGVLSTRSAIWLGDISYGVYLCHGLLIWNVFFALRAAGLLVAVNSYWFVPLVLALGAAVTILASVSYLVLELPTIAVGKRWSQRHRAQADVPQQAVTVLMN